MDDTRLGPLLLEGHLVKEEDLDRCLEIQALTGGSRPLGQILVEQNLISPQDVDGLLELQKERREARSGGLLSPEELDALMAEHATGTKVELPVVLSGQGCEPLLEAAIAAGATDLILSEGRPPMARIAEQFRSLSSEPLDAPDVWQFVREHMGDRALEELAERKSLRQPFHLPGRVRGRIMAFRHFEGACVTLRLHPEEVRSPGQAGLTPNVLQALHAGKGLVLLTGEMGCGMSSVIASMLNEIAQEDPRLVLILDEDIEIEVEDSSALIVKRQVGVDAGCTRRAIEAATRMNPDVIVIGDAGTPEVFDLALRAAEGSRLVIAAVHARSTRGALQRIFDFYSSLDIGRMRSTLASVLSCVMRLQPIPRADGKRTLMATEVLMMDAAARAVLREAPLEHLELLLNMEGTTSGHSLDGNLERLLAGGEVLIEDCFQLADNKSKFLKHHSLS